MDFLPEEFEEILNIFRGETEEIIQKFLMGNLPHPPPFQKRIIQSPAYIIVTPQIIEEGTGRGQGTDRLHLAF